jgi:hypothetical protein
MEASPESSPVVDVIPEVIAPPIVDAEITDVVEEGDAPKPKRAAKGRKTAAPKKVASRKPRARKAP